MTLGATQIKVANIKPTTIVLPLAGPAGIGGGGGSVASVFGRIANVVALAGDYAAFYDALGAANTAVAGEVTARNTAITTAASALLAKAQNLADLVSTSAARTNLGLGDIATHSVTDFVTPSQQTAAIAALVNAAPTLLDTLSEIDAAINNDPNFATTIATQMATKANDNVVVHNTGTETIAGIKTFSSAPVVPDNSFAEAKVAGLVADLTALQTAINARLIAANNLSDLTNLPQARTNLGLGTAAIKDTGTASGQVGLLGTGGRFGVALLGSGVPDGTKFLRDDGTFATPAGGSSSSILLGLTYYAPATNAHYTQVTTSTITVVDTTNLKTPIFIAPTSGQVLVRLTGLYRSTQTSYWCLVDHGTTTLRGILVPPQWQVGSVLTTLTTSILVSGLTPGNSYQFDWAWCGVGGTAELFMQGVTVSTGTPVAGPGVMEVWSA